MQDRGVLVSHAGSTPGDKTGGYAPKNMSLDPSFQET